MELTPLIVGAGEWGSDNRDLVTCVAVDWLASVTRTTKVKVPTFVGVRSACLSYPV